MATSTTDIQITTQIHKAMYLLYNQVLLQVWKNQLIVYCHFVLVVVVLFRPLVREVCPNYDVVVFQPRTLTTPHLGCLRLTSHFNLAILPHIFLLSFMDHLPPPFPTASPPAAVHFSKLSRFTQSTPPLPAQISAHTVLVGTHESLNL